MDRPQSPRAAAARIGGLVKNGADEATIAEAKRALQIAKAAAQVERAADAVRAVSS